MGATASVEAPSADDLKRLYDKHDITGSGHLEKQEARPICVCECNRVVLSLRSHRHVLLMTIM